MDAFLRTIVSVVYIFTYISQIDACKYFSKVEIAIKNEFWYGYKINGRIYTFMYFSFRAQPVTAPAVMK